MSCPTPEYATARRERTPTRGHLLAAVAQLLGWELFEWQRHAADVALQYDIVTRTPLYRTVGVSVARQNGKTTLVCARVAMQLAVPRSTVAYTAQDRNLAHFKWREHVDLLMSTPFRDRVARVDRVNGREQLVTEDGSRYLIVTPGEKAGRGLSLDLAVIDEAFAHADLRVVGALMPTLAARRSAQMWLLSNAGTYTSGLWRHFTDLGRASVDDATSPVCWLEWCPPEGAAIDDEYAWADANPTLDLPHGVQRSALRQGLVTLDASTFQREHMNVWPDMSTIIGIDPVTWAACRDDHATLAEHVTIAIDITPDRHGGAICAASELRDGRIALEVIDSGSNIETLITRVVEIARRWDAQIVLDRSAPIASIIPLLERAQLDVRALTVPDVVRACGDFHDAVTHGRIAHRGDYRLTDAIASATKRRVADAWLWSRRDGGDISPLVAATLARWGIVSAALEPIPTVF